MKAKPRPKQQFCLRGHDTHVAGRYSDGRCKQCKAEQKRREDLANRVAPEYVPDLLPLRESRGHTAREVVEATGMDEASRMDEADYLAIEGLERKATQEERLAILHAFGALKVREKELLEKEIEMASRMRMTGVL